MREYLFPFAGSRGAMLAFTGEGVKPARHPTAPARLIGAVKQEASGHYARSWW